MTDNSRDEQASLDFLKSFATKGTGRYRRVFVFMHVPPPVPSFDSRKFTASDAFLPLFHDLHVSYVLASHYHGYVQTRFGDTTYIVTGGGGARLDHSDKDYQPFYHAVLLQVGKDHVSERILHARRWHDPEDQIKQFAVSMVFPWMSRHRGVLSGINAGFLLLLLAATLPLRKRRRTPSP